MKDHIVTVIALCYNHAPYVSEALNSVMHQSYKNIQLIIVDDGSSDGSSQIIKNWLKKYQHGEVIFHEINQGNCKSFNEALKLAKGEYVIDFATDDVMYSDMVESQVKAFNGLPSEFGVLFSDTLYINSDGKQLRGHYRRDSSGKLVSKVPSGNVYMDVVRSYFISPPSVIFRREMLESLGGYDVSLAYEDFDIWVRASRKFKFYFLDKILIKKRVLNNSLSTKFVSRVNQISFSTFRVCEKIQWLNITPEEDEALKKRIQYEMKIAYYTSNFKLVNLYFKMLKEMGKSGFKDRLIYQLSRRGIDVYYLYKAYLRVRL